METFLSPSSGSRALELRARARPCQAPQAPPRTSDIPRQQAFLWSPFSTVSSLALLGFCGTCWSRQRCKKIQRLPRHADRVIRGGTWTLDELQDKVKPVPVDENGKPLSVGEVRHMELRQKQISSLNNFMLQKHRKSRNKGVAPQLLYTEEPDNPWRDRYLLCEDCEKRANYGAKPPRANCNNSTLLELDMTAAFSRDNVMVTSCDIVQMIREDVWVYKDKYGKLCRGVRKAEGTFPVQVCAVCRKTTLQEGRAFKKCNVCRGVFYCSDECRAAHNLKHQATCVRPHMPYRGEWGVRRELRDMRSEIYPLINTWALKEPEQHRIAWLPPPAHQQKILDAQRPRKKISLPSGARGRKLLADGIARSCVEDGKIVLRGAAPVPDQSMLDMIGMTEEEYLQQDLLLRKEVEVEDSSARSAMTVVEEVEEEKGEDLTLKNGRFGGQQVRPKTTLRGDHLPVPVREVPKLVLDQGAIARMEAAVKSGEVVDIDETQFAPTKPIWEMPRPEQAKTFWEPLPEEEKKEGVVYPESPVRELAKKYGLKLSEEALERLEATAAKAEHNRHRMRWQKPLIVDDAKERLS